MFSNQAPESNLTVVRFVLIDQSVASSSRLSCYQASSGYRSSTASSRHLSRSRDEAATHASHIGVEACIRRARDSLYWDSLYWPRMSTELKEYIAKCDVCMAHRSEQSKEPFQRHDLAARPWSKVAVDLCDLDRRTLLVIDWFSKRTGKSFQNGARS